MESMAYIYYNSATPGAAFKTSGDLRYYQREPLGHRGLDSRFNMSVIDSTSVYAESYDLSSIFEKYEERNMTTRFVNTYPVWVLNRGAGKPFQIKVTIRYPDETLEYRPGFWQLIKWAWVQYVAILLVFVFVMYRIKDFIFQNQLVPTIIERPFKQHMH